MSFKDQGNLPSHVGIIMDGNGRWARERGMNRSSGHREGLEAAKRIVAHASGIGISCLSLYVFSTENWRRAKEEVDFLMDLIKTHLRSQYDFYRKHGLRVIHSGDMKGLAENVKREILLAENDTLTFNGMKVNLLINYGGRNEVVRSVNRFLSSFPGSERISEDSINKHMDHPDIPELDLLIRSGGEHRLSNFLIWQAAYAELYFSDIYWPDWDSSEFDKAIEHYCKRKRRFGGNGL